MLNFVVFGFHQWWRGLGSFNSFIKDPARRDHSMSSSVQYGKLAGCDSGRSSFHIIYYYFVKKKI